MAGWVLFAGINIGLMFALTGAETIPFHFVWISFALLHGLRPLRRPALIVTLLAITCSTFFALYMHARAGAIGIEETAEVPLMAGLFLVMVWHVDRRAASLREVELLAALERRRAEAQRLFVRVSSHELRTPVTVARGYTELIRTAHPDPETDEDTGIVLDELAKLERITARLLTLMLVETALPPTLVDFDAVLERIIRRWAPTARRRWEVDSAVGAAMVNVDRLETALDSLLENAVKFTGTADVIALRAWKSGGDILIEVRDTGSGILPADLPYVSGAVPGGRIPDPKAGTGLGLPIVRAALAARGGTVTVTSKPGAGATFLLRFPEKVPTVIPAAAMHDASDAVTGPARTSGRPLSPA